MVRFLGLLGYLKPHEKEAMRHVLESLLKVYDFLEKEFPFDKQVYLNITPNGTIVWVKPKAWLGKEKFKEYARKYGWNTLFGFRISYPDIKIQREYFKKFTLLLYDRAGAQKYDTRREHIEKALEVLERIPERMPR